MEPLEGWRGDRITLNRYFSLEGPGYRSIAEEAECAWKLGSV
jgi:hypothetical protein